MTCKCQETVLHWHESHGACVFGEQALDLHRLCTTAAPCLSGQAVVEDARNANPHRGRNVALRQVTDGMLCQLRGGAAGR